MNKLNNSDKYNQLKKEVTGRKSQLQIENNEEVRLAAVSILIENDNDNYPIYMIKRADEGVHALEWAFPGGKYEEEDTDLLDTAKRETHEEIGIPNDFISFWGPLDPVYTLGTGWKIFPFIGVVKSDIKTVKNEEEDLDLLDTAKRETHEEIGISNDFISFWGPLDPVYTLGTGWKIFPFIGVVKSDIETIKNEEEVQEITKIPLFKLLESKNNRYVSFTTNNGRIDSKSYVYENKLIWGASARSISQINRFI